MARLALLGAIACAVGVVAQTGTAGAGSGTNIVTDAGSVAHLMLTTPAQQQQAQQLGSTASNFACSAGNLVYDTTNNGPVMRNPTNYLIFWATSRSRRISRWLSGGHGACAVVLNRDILLCRRAGCHFAEIHRAISIS